jgi:hypothetical protein
MTHAPSESRPQRQVSVLVALIVAIATPATLALSYYRITGDPTFQPLALTVERLVAGGEEVHHKAVRAVIVSNNSTEGLVRAARLGKRIEAAFYGKGTEALVRYITAGPSNRPTVTFHVARATFGPYPEATAAHGVSAAVEALQLSRNFQDGARDHSW